MGSFLANPFVVFPVGGDFDPSDITNQKLLLDGSLGSSMLESDDTPPEGGDNIKEWQDQFTSGNDATQSTGTKQPTYQTAEINSKSIVRFDGGDDMSLPDGILSTDASYSYFAVVKSADWDASQNVILGLGNNTQDTVLLWTDSSQTFKAYHANGNRVTSSTLTDSEVYIVSVIHDASANTLEMWLDGSSQGSASSVPATTNQSTNSSVGSYRRSLWFFNGDIAEMIIYEQAVTSTERGNVETYLSNKWGVTI